MHLHSGEISKSRPPTWSILIFTIYISHHYFFLNTSALNTDFVLFYSKTEESWKQKKMKIWFKNQSVTISKTQEQKHILSNWLENRLFLSMSCALWQQNPLTLRSTPQRVESVLFFHSSFATSRGFKRNLFISSRKNLQ